MANISRNCLSPPSRSPSAGSPFQYRGRRKLSLLPYVVMYDVLSNFGIPALSLLAAQPLVNLTKFEQAGSGGAKRLKKCCRVEAVSIQKQILDNASCLSVFQFCATFLVYWCHLLFTLQTVCVGCECNVAPHFWVQNLPRSHFGCCS